MDDYIKREAAIKAFNNFDAGRADSPPFTLLTPEEFAEYLYELPAADVAPVVHGRWTAQCVVELDGGWTLEDVPYNEYQHSNPICSVCRKTALLDGGEDYVTSPYCPNCGARMDGGADDAAD